MNEALAMKLVAEAPETEPTVTLLIPDMRCAACSRAIEEAMSADGRVTRFGTNLAEKKLHLALTQETDPADVMQVLRDLGYSAVKDNDKTSSDALAAERKSLVARLGVAGIAMMQVMMFALADYVSGPEGLAAAYEALFRWASLGLAIPVFLYSAMPFHQGAIRDLKHFRLGMDVPVSLAITAAFTLSLVHTFTQGGEVYFDSVTMFTFFLLIARVVELRSRTRFQATRGLTDHLLSDWATLTDGSRVPRVSLSEGDLVVVAPGEVFPADGTLQVGVCSADESAFSGESRPAVKGFGDKLLAGSRNLDATVTLRVTEASDTVISHLTRLYETSSTWKPAFSRLADRIAGVFVSFILLLALGTGTFWYVAGNADWFVIAMTVLVVSCPCALSLATPVAYTIAATSLRKMGVSVRDGSFTEKLAQVDMVAFDKTGTLTEGRLALASIRVEGLSEAVAIAHASALEAGSAHPVRHAFGASDVSATDIEDVAGEGRRGTINGEVWSIGKPSFVGVDAPDPEGYWIAMRGPQALAFFELEDKPRTDAEAMTASLRSQSVDAVMLSGDVSTTAHRLAGQLGLDEVHARLRPEEKVAYVHNRQNEGRRVLMVGDGINDAGAFGAAAVSLAVRPVDAFVQSSADATLLGEKLMPVADMIEYAVRVRRIIRQNLAWAASYNLSVIPLAAIGVLEPWMAALGMSVSSILVVLNANRLALRGPENAPSIETLVTPATTDMATPLVTPRIAKHGAN